MTDEEKKAYREKLIADFMMYSHIDYDDDADIVELMLDATLEELSVLIPNFDPYKLTSRQRLLVLVFTKELYDNREKYKKDRGSMANAVSSMLLKEKYGGGRT
nr:MAG: head-tail connector protein [Bacteriophage sp.]